jgi:protease I
MAENNLNGKRIAFLATDGVEQVELTEPWQAVKAAGGTPELISLKSGKIQGWNHDKKGKKFNVDKLVHEASAENYDGLVLPGGVMNPDTLRTFDEAVDFVRDFFKQEKPVASICHGPWMLVEADVVGGRKLTSWPSVKTDIRNAGGQWIDEEVVVDNGLVTSRRPDDLPAFCAKAVEEFAEGRHEAQGIGARASFGNIERGAPAYRIDDL